MLRAYALYINSKCSLAVTMKPTLLIWTSRCTLSRFGRFLGQSRPPKGLHLRSLAAFLYRISSKWNLINN